MQFNIYTFFFFYIRGHSVDVCLTLHFLLLKENKKCKRINLHNKILFSKREKEIFMIDFFDTSEAF